MPTYLIDNHTHARAGQVKRLSDGGGDIFNQLEIQGCVQDNGPELHYQGLIQEGGPGYVKPMSFHDGPVFNPDGIHLEIVLGGSAGNFLCETPWIFSADRHVGEFIRGRGSPLAAVEIGEERGGHFQSSGFVVSRMATVDENAEFPQEDIGHDSSPLEISRSMRPRKRGDQMLLGGCVWCLSLALNPTPDVVFLLFMSRFSGFLSIHQCIASEALLA
ncbi:hypothetical protein Dimus_017524 [Dionaea muscipula]